MIGAVEFRQEYNGCGDTQDQCGGKRLIQKSVQRGNREIIRSDHRDIQAHVNNAA